MIVGLREITLRGSGFECATGDLQRLWEERKPFRALRYRKEIFEARGASAQFVQTAAALRIGAGRRCGELAAPKGIRAAAASVAGVARFVDGLGSVPARPELQARPLSDEGGLVKPWAIFLGKDGTVLVPRPGSVEPSQMELMVGAARGLRRLSAAGYPLIVVSNQPGVAMGRFPEQALTAVGHRLFEMLSEIGCSLTGFWYCPHHPDGQIPAYAVDCGCRKPRPGLLLAAGQHHGIDLSASWMIGAALDDVEAGGRAGCRTILLDNGQETLWRPGPFRIPHAVASDLWEAAGLILGTRSRELAV